MSRTIPASESLTVEFKSDVRPLSDNDLVIAAVCLANTDGGTIYLGIEDDGTITGLNESRRRDVVGVASMIANRTVPPLGVRVEAIECSTGLVAAVDVPRSQRLVATSNGTLQRRRLRADGTPECVPFLPHEFPAHQADLGLLDFSSLPVVGASIDDFDPLERERVRRAIERYGGDVTLSKLDDRELDGALGFARLQGGALVPTVTGLLLIGRQGALREHVPTHEIAFQVLNDTDVLVNDFLRLPLLAAFERVEEHFLARLIEREVQVGLFRVPVPQVDRRCFREALVNALAHRDYARMGPVYVRWQRETLSISNPGGFVEGVSLDNLLVVEPRPRNALLADVLKRIGLAERTGRGIDLIFKGLLRYGRPAPNYRRSDRTTVIVELSCAEADLNFLSLVLDEEQRFGGSIPIDTLIVLSMLREQKRLDTSAFAQAIQKDVPAARAVLERLVEVGLVEAHGVKKGRTYTLSARVYRQLGQAASYTRQAGFEPLQQEQLLRNFVREHGSIRRGEVIDLCRVSAHQAKRMLAKLVDDEALVRVGSGRATRYEAGQRL